MSKLTKTIAYAVCCLGVAGLGLAMLSAILAEREVRANLAVVKGRVTEVGEERHGMVDYVYQVNGREFRGVDNPGARTVAVGDTVTVYYSSKKPKVSLLDRSKLDDTPSGFDRVFLIFALLGTVGSAFGFATNLRSVRKERAEDMQSAEGDANG